MKKKNYGKHKQFLHVIMIQSYFEYLFANSDQYSDYKISPFVHEMAKIYIFRGRGFHTPVGWKIGYYVINKQVIVQILIVNTAFYIYDNMKLKEISILNLFEQIKENTISGSAFSARLGSSAVAFIPDPLDLTSGVNLVMGSSELSAEDIIDAGSACQNLTVYGKQLYL